MSEEEEDAFSVDGSVSWSKGGVQDYRFRVLRRPPIDTGVGLKNARNSRIVATPMPLSPSIKYLGHTFI